jgi:vacuolar protein sorting-associated protein 54
LDTVPAVFFDPDFSLVDPVTFALVTEQLHSNLDNGSLEQDPASISYSVPLLEKLSHYADTVEGHLVREIQDRSAAFFSALTNLHDLQTESERCLRRITELKSMLTQVDEKGAKKGLELVREDMKVSHLTRLEDGVKLVKDIQNMKAIAQGLASAGEWNDALNMVENLHALLDPTPRGQTPPAGETQRQYHSPIAEEEEESAAQPKPSPTPSRNTVRSKLPAALRDVSLQKLQAFVSLPADLRILTTQIASTLSDDFAAVSRQDLILRAEESEHRQSQGRAREDEHALRERFVPMLTGLLRTGDNGLKEGLEKWREVLMADVRSAVKKVCPRCKPLPHLHSTSPSIRIC